MATPSDKEALIAALQTLYSPTSTQERKAQEQANAFLEQFQKSVIPPSHSS